MTKEKAGEELLHALASCALADMSAEEVTAHVREGAKAMRLLGGWLDAVADHVDEARKGEP